MEGIAINLKIKLQQYYYDEMKVPNIIILSETDFMDLKKEFQTLHGQIPIKEQGSIRFMGIDVISSKEVNEIKIF